MALASERSVKIDRVWGTQFRKNVMQIEFLILIDVII